MKIRRPRQPLYSHALRNKFPDDKHTTEDQEDCRYCAVGWLAYELGFNFDDRSPEGFWGDAYSYVSEKLGIENEHIDRLWLDNDQTLVEDDHKRLVFLQQWLVAHGIEFDKEFEKEDVR